MNFALIRFIAGANRKAVVRKKIAWCIWYWNYNIWFTSPFILLARKFLC